MARTRHFAGGLAVTLLLATPAIGAPVQTEARATAPATSVKSTDDALEDRIEFRLETAPTIKKYHVDADVKNGVAELSGDVATAAQKEEAARLAKVTGITRVDNKISVNPDADKAITERAKAGLSKAGEKIDDAWITTKVKWFFLGEDELKGSEINVDTKQNVVTLKGTVSSEAGRTRAKQLAADTDGVKRVVDELTIAAKAK